MFNSLLERKRPVGARLNAVEVDKDGGRSAERLWEPLLELGEEVVLDPVLHWRGIFGRRPPVAQKDVEVVRHGDILSEPVRPEPTLDMSDLGRGRVIEAPMAVEI